MDFIDRQGLIRYLREQFQINWFGHHGIAHWARVRANGLMLAQETGANDHVVELFAWFHDARRVGEHEDDGHGSRGAALAQQLNGHFFEATDAEMALLLHACRYHSDGLMTDDVTVMTCWDADRLDLGRVGMVPEPRYLCTKAARRNSSLEKANNRASSWKQRFDATRQEQLSQALRN
jgi:uncharacterized protein